MQNNKIKSLIEDRKFIFFGGKGGVGKTTMAAATAVWLADNGYNTIIIATDPTISLSAIYEQQVNEINLTKINNMKNLSGLSINPQKATGVFQKRLDGMMQNMEGIFGNEMASTPCMEEIAAFDQFVSFLQDQTHDRVIFDTAPTGHTLRELSMPFDWSSYVSRQIHDRKILASALGNENDESISAELKNEKARYDEAINILTEGTKSAFNLVLLPEKLPIEETARAINDLAKFGIKTQNLIINQIIPTEVLQGNWFLKRRQETQEKYLMEIKGRFESLSKMYVPLFDTDVFGIENLRKVGSFLYDN